ncbi:hypothetical protein V8G54_023985 [Vigna mungo]|uniref:QWRF motif-containing protein 3 n=1 Tax=Vigna mungo TaxID=3915 RepID=A0AAQ3N548_VIGMU
MKSDSNGSVSPYSPKPRTRIVSSRFMSPNSTASPEPGSGSPLGRFNRLARKDSTTLADHFGNERLKEREERHQHQNKTPANKTGSVFSALTKQRSCREFRNNSNCLEENDQDRHVVGRTTKNGVSGKSPSPSPFPVVKKPSSYFDPARHSLDENTFKGSFLCAKNSIDSESENRSLDSVPLERTFSSRKLGREVSSKYMAECGRRGEASDSDPLSFDDSWMMKKNMTQKAVKKANSFIGYMSSKSQWALSPGRSGSPPLSFESKDKDKPLSFSNLKPPHKRVEKILSMGFDLFRTKKSLSTSEVVHQLRLLHNRLIQWRFANARAHTVNHSMSLQAQMKLLETWGCMERQHLAAITTMRECLHYVICKVPLLNGAKVDIPLVSITERYASDLTDSIVAVLSSFLPLAYKTSELISKLARIVAEEKLLLQEFNDVFHDICVLEVTKFLIFS